MVIDCDCCALRESVACRDCVVTFVLGAERSVPIEVAPAEVRALELLSRAGLVPQLRHRRATMSG